SQIRLRLNTGPHDHTPPNRRFVGSKYSEIPLKSRGEILHVLHVSSSSRGLFRTAVSLSGPSFLHPRPGKMEGRRTLSDPPAFRRDSLWSTSASPAPSRNTSRRGI